MRELTNIELKAVAGGGSKSCRPKPQCERKKVVECRPKPVCKPKRSCDPVREV